MSGVHLLSVTEYRINITREGDTIIEDLETQVESDNYNIRLESMHGLPGEATKVAQFNERQLQYCKEDENRDFILKRIINNNHNN